MLNAEQIAALRDAAMQIADPINEYLLADIARRIASAGQLTSSAAYEIWKMQQLGVSQREIKKQLRKLLKVSHRDLRRLLTQAAETGYRYDLSQFPQVQAVPFAQNDAVVKLAQEDLTNFTQTLGMVDPFGRALPLQQAYRSSMDFAFQQVSTGAADYNTAIRRACQNLAKNGVRVIDYESGVHTSLEAAVRRNVMGGLGLMQEQISQQTHDDLGADGWEISAHANSAPDHEPIQGKQYSDAEYTALNNSLVRRIGTLNCGHAAFPIILGISKPQYSPEELQKFRDGNAAGITYGGRHYSGYEATQLQRRLERAIRLQKRRIFVDEAAGDKVRLQQDQIKLRIRSEEYKRFCRAAGFRTQDDRLYTEGFGRKQANEARKTFEKYSSVRYNKDGTVVVTDDWTNKGHTNIPQKFMPNAVLDTVSQRGTQRDRLFYDADGRLSRQVSNGPHGNPKRHPYGTRGEHAHDVIWKDGQISGRPAREITESERRENGDIL